MVNNYSSMSLILIIKLIFRKVLDTNKFVRTFSKSREQERDKALRAKKRNVRVVYEYFELVFNAVSLKRSRL